MTVKNLLNSIKSFIYGIVAFIIVAMSFFHISFNKYSPEYLEHKKVYKPIIKEREKLQDSLANELGKTLSITEYQRLRTEAWEFSKSRLKKYNVKKDELYKAHMFLGRSNLRFWLFVFGIVLLGFYFSIKSLIDDLKKDLDTGHKFISIAGISVCLFWFYHLFFQTAEDFYRETYFLYGVGIALMSGFFMYGLIRYFIKKESLQEIIRSLFDFILIEVPDRDMIKDHRKEEYHDKSVELLKNALDNE